MYIYHSMVLGSIIKKIDLKEIWKLHCFKIFIEVPNEYAVKKLQFD